MRGHSQIGQLVAVLASAIDVLAPGLSGGLIEARWLQTDGGYAMTSRVACEVALRLATGDRRPVAHTPGRLFGPSLAESVGAHILANGA